VKLTMIDMGISNLQSVLGAFSRIGAEVLVSDDPVEVEAAEALILPGVGSFGDAMAALRRKGLVEPIRRHAVERSRPLLGICLGMQLLTETGEEHGSHEGLGLIPGRTVRLRPQDPAARVPNIGWCDLEVTRPGRLFNDTPARDSFYFAHSFQVECHGAEDVAATIDHGGRIAAAIECGSVFGVQFHPEKSQDAGLSVLESFVEACA
jgi:imidazole glycerol-phosphate synthase subunit HisH